MATQEAVQAVVLVVVDGVERPLAPEVEVLAVLALKLAEVRVERLLHLLILDFLAGLGVI